MQQGQGPDAVYLKDNNVIRGTLSEVVVGDHVTVLLTSGQTARVLWAFVARIDHNGQPLDTSVRAAPPAPTAPTAPTPPSAPAGNVTVHIEGDDVTLEQMSNGGWAGVCSTPCDRALPLGPSYRITGDGVRTSRAFLLAGANGDRLVLDVSTASKSDFAGGIVLLSIGSLFTVIGGFTLLIVAAVNAAPGYTNTDGAERAGWIMFGGGLAGLVTGIVLMSSNGSSKVQQVLAPRGTAARLDLFVQGEARDRAPVFHEDTMSAVMPKAPVLPIFSGSF